MTDDFEAKLRRWIADEERGSWREAMRTDFAPWFDMLHLGFQCGDGWAALLHQLTAEIARLVGGPHAEPGLRVTSVKQKHGTLRFYVLGLPAAQSDAVDQAIMTAEEMSARTCETCGAKGELRQTCGGYLYVACDRHATR